MEPTEAASSTEQPGREALIELARRLNVPVEWLEWRMLAKLGTSNSAYRRWCESSRGQLFIQGRPGQIVPMSDRQYVIAKDGSLRTIKEDAA